MGGQPVLGEQPVDEAKIPTVVCDRLGIGIRAAGKDAHQDRETRTCLRAPNLLFNELAFHAILLV
jgi:hypothetical protein